MQQTQAPKRRPIGLNIAALAFACAAAFSAQAQDSANPPDEKALTNPLWIQAGRDKFVYTCAYCHGQEGDAGKNRPFRERVDWDPLLIHDVIANGRKRGANVMPAWSGAIADEEIWQIVAFIRSLSGKPRPDQ